MTVEKFPHPDIMDLGRAIRKLSEVRDHLDEIHTRHMMEPNPDYTHGPLKAVGEAISEVERVRQGLTDWRDGLKG